MLQAHCGQKIKFQPFVKEVYFMTPFFALWCAKKNIYIFIKMAENGPNLNKLYCF